MSQQARFDMLERERLLEQWIVEQIDLSDGEIVGGAPVGVHPGHFILGKWFFVKECGLVSRSGCCHFDLAFAQTAVFAGLGAYHGRDPVYLFDSKAA